MGKSIRLSGIAVVLALFLVFLSACQKDVDSAKFISVLEKNGVTARIVHPSSENDSKEITEGYEKDKSMYYYLYRGKDSEDAQKYYDSMKGMLHDLAATPGTEGQCEEGDHKNFKKCIAHLKYAENDGSGDGSYTILIWQNRSVITIMSDSLSETGIEKAIKVAKELGFEW